MSKKKKTILYTYYIRFRIEAHKLLNDLGKHLIQVYGAIT